MKDKGQSERTREKRNERGVIARKTEEQDGEWRREERETEEEIKGMETRILTSKNQIKEIQMEITQPIKKAWRQNGRKK